MLLDLRKTRGYFHPKLKDKGLALEYVCKYLPYTSVSGENNKPLIERWQRTWNSSSQKNKSAWPISILQKMLSLVKQ